MKLIRHINLSILLILFSCNENKTDKIAIYDREDFYKKIKIIDTTCINSEKRAEKDFESGKAKISKYHLYSCKDFLPNEVISKELKKINISLDITPEENIFDSIGNLKPFRKNCYQDMMRRKIHQKISYQSIDSILELSAKNYILKHPNLIIDKTDLDKSYENSDGEVFAKCLDKLKLGFNFDFKYPNGYISDTKKTSSTIVSFIVLKNGHLKDIEVTNEFKNLANKNFENYFTSSVKELINSIKWTAPHSAGLPVNVKIKIGLKHY